MKKFLAIMLSMAMVLSLAACGSSSEPTSEPEKTEEGEEAEAPAGDVKVALILPGSINDEGWCYSAYCGLMAIADIIGEENTSYMEYVETSAYEEAYRNYATSGYNVIFGHGAEFYDSAVTVGPEFPDCLFVVNSTDDYSEPNIASLNTAPDHMGILAGAGAAYATESKIVGVIAGSPYYSTLMACNAYSAAVKMVDPEITVLATAIGNDTDTAKAKELALSMIDNGADVIFYDADAAGLGAREACQEKGVTCISAIADQNAQAPEVLLMSACQDFPYAMAVIVQEYIDGKAKAQHYSYGCGEGVVTAAINDGVWSKLIDADEQAAWDDIYNSLCDGSLDGMQVIKDYAEGQDFFLQ